VNVVLAAVQRAHIVDDLAPSRHHVPSAASLGGWLVIAVLAAVLPLAVLTMVGADVDWAAPLALIASLSFFYGRSARRVAARAAVRRELASLPDAELACRYARLCELHTVAGAPMPSHMRDILEEIRAQQRELLLDASS
jgi:hypothetical protein